MRSCIAQFGMMWKDHSTMWLSGITVCDKTRYDLAENDEHWEIGAEIKRLNLAA